ncbi:Kidins220 [Symbiodinium sp. CCMP2456]|nr:Kidins220 [Symbiodinium sp. CCMP2456]
MVRIWRASGEELSVTTDELREYMAGESWPDDPNVGTLKDYLRAKHGFPVCLQEVLQANSFLQAATKLEETMELQLVLKAVDGNANLLAAANEFTYDAIGAGRLDVARFLLEAGLPARLFLQEASREGHAGIVDLLLKSRADVDAVLNWSGGSALHEALKSCHGEMPRTRKGKLPFTCHPRTASLGPWPGS